MRSSDVTRTKRFGAAGRGKSFTEEGGTGLVVRNTVRSQRPAERSRARRRFTAAWTKCLGTMDSPYANCPAGFRSDGAVMSSMETVLPLKTMRVDPDPISKPSVARLRPDPRGLHSFSRLPDVLGRGAWVAALRRRNLRGELSVSRIERKVCERRVCRRR